jgi:predicted Zn-ribbon and HTH transcriptional regulator
MTNHEEHILRVLGGSTEPLFTSEIAELLNLELRPATAYTTIKVVRVLQDLHEQAVQLADGRWMLKRLML